MKAVNTFDEESVADFMYLHISFRLDPLYAEMYIDSEGKHVCIRCQKKYIHMRHLKRHIKFECGVEPQFTCGYCLRKFKHNSHLKGHVFRKHGVTYT
ncbi:hypothetical protein QE152_g36742 [Popillia japonica]|uniref:C2H2-type domain-containing protein n=1 Tax=Popillia japonica TaxID=7064 RepID=A0AAW1ICM4_POPJA